MSKTIKIRFVETLGYPSFSAQRKTWFGWRDIGYNLCWGYGDTLFFNYFHSTKELLLEEILEKYYKTDKRFVTIIEYPSLKIH